MRIGENNVSPLCFPVLRGQPRSLMGPTDMRSAVMITSRDFPLVCLYDGRPRGQINNQPTVATQVTIFISNFLSSPRSDESFEPAAQGHLLLSSGFSHLLLAFSSTKLTNSSFLEAVFSGIVFEVREDTSNCLNDGMNRSKCSAANAHITIHARGLF